MVSKTIAILIALSSTTLLAHDNINHVSTNAGTSGPDSVHLKINHQSYFYLPSDDMLILDLTHALHAKHMQNETGLAYRKSLEKLTLGANLYYMHTTQPGVYLHQFSPGLELFYKKFQVSYNFYLPTSAQRDFKKGTISHSTVSEFGLRWSPRKDFNIGLLPFYDHLNRSFGVNSRINYTVKEVFHFGVSPFYKPKGSGVMFSFGISFGSAKDKKSTHRSNEFNHFVKYYPAKNPTISVVMPKQMAIPTSEPVVEYPLVVPAELDIKAVEEANKVDEKNKEAVTKPWSIWNYLPIRGKQTALAAEHEPKADFFLLYPPTPELTYQVIDRSTLPQEPVRQHIEPAIIHEDYVPNPIPVASPYAPYQIKENYGD